MKRYFVLLLSTFLIPFNLYGQEVEQTVDNIDQNLTIQLEHLGSSRGKWMDLLDAGQKKSLLQTFDSEDSELSFTQRKIRNDENISTLEKLLVDIEDPEEQSKLVSLMRVLGRDSKLATVRPVVGSDEAELLTECSNIKIPSSATINGGLQVRNLARGISCDKRQAIAMAKYLKNEKKRDLCVSAADALLTQTSTTSSAIKRYLDRCGIKHVSKINKRKEWRSIVDRVGVFINSQRGVFCSGFLLDGETILTARHCNFDEFGNVSSETGIRWLEHPETRFELYGEYETVIRSQYMAKDGACNGIYLEKSDRTIQSCDYIKLKLRHSVPAVEPMKLSKSVSLFQPLNPIGYHYYQQLSYKGFGLASEKQLQREQNVKDWRTGLVMNQLPTCAVYEEKTIQVSDSTKARCIKHGCQTIKRMSGSPIFSKVDGDIVLVAVHIGFNGQVAAQNQLLSSWKNSGTCEFSNSTDGLNLRNIAIALNH